LGRRPPAAFERGFSTMCRERRPGVLSRLRQWAPLVVALWLGALMAPVPALARVSGALPLSHPAWHNPWARDPAVAGPDPGRWAEVTALYLGGDLQGAARALEEMLAAGFDEAAVRRSLAAVYKDLGEYGRAAAEYQRL